jgi:uncharacterized protein YegP (UPF0339 family)
MAIANCVEVFLDDAGEFRWHRRGGDGEVVADSGEGYTNYSDAYHQADKEAQAFGLSLIDLTEHQE